MWKKELTRLHSKSWTLPLTLDRWKHKTHQKWKWKYWLDEENDELAVLTEQGVEVYGKVPGGRRQYSIRAGELREAPVGEPATVKEEANGCLNVIDMGPPLATTTEELESNFLQHPRSYWGKLFWEDLHTPDGIEWMPAVMLRGRLTSVTDGSYIRHLAPNICGAGGDNILSVWGQLNLYACIGNWSK